MSKTSMVVGMVVVSVVSLSVCWMAGAGQEVVHNDLWDGSVAQVKLFLREDDKDARVIQWGKVEKTAAGNFRVPCIVRTIWDDKPVYLDLEFTFGPSGQYLHRSTIIRGSGAKRSARRIGDAKTPGGEPNR